MPVRLVKDSNQFLLLKKFLNCKKDGFTLVELVVVVSVLSILSAVAIPSFNCFQRKAKATSVLAAMKQIKLECAINRSTTGNSGSYTSTNFNSYQIQSNGSNSCSGDQESGLISAIPYDTKNLPTFILTTTSNELTYKFKGITGNNFSDCLSSLCLGGSTKLSLFNQKFKQAVANGETLEDKFYRRGDTIYAIVKGETWEAAQEKAKSLWGSLASVNDQGENDWLVNELFGDDNASTKLTDRGSAIWLGHKLNSSGSYVSVSGDENLYNNWGSGEYSDGIGKGEQYTILNLYDNYARDPGSINTVANQQNGEAHIFYGLAEIKLNEIEDVDETDLD